jgi:transcriptional regulator with XRE-family HTH domain
MTPFGIRLRQLRQEKGLTLAMLSRTLGVTQAYISQLENGHKGQPSAVLVDQICAVFGLIWDEAEALKAKARQSRVRVVIDTSQSGPEATRAANLMAEILPRIDDDEARLMAEWLEDRQKKL